MAGGCPATGQLLGPDGFVVLTGRARAWAFEQAADHDAAVSATAEQLGMAWWTVMDQVIDRGTPLIEDPARLDPARRARRRLFG